MRGPRAHVAADTWRTRGSDTQTRSAAWRRPAGGRAAPRPGRLRTENYFKIKMLQAVITSKVIYLLIIRMTKRGQVHCTLHFDLNVK